MDDNSTAGQYPGRPAFRSAALLAVAAGGVVGGVVGGVAGGAAAQPIDAKWLTPGSGKWSEGSRWSTDPIFPHERGAARYTAIIDVPGASFTITVDVGGGVILDGLHLSSAVGQVVTLAGGNRVTVRQSAALRGGVLGLPSGFVSELTLIFAGDIDTDIDFTPLDHTGQRVEWTGDGDIVIRNGSIFTHGRPPPAMPSRFEIFNEAHITGDGSGSFINNGKISKESGGVTEISGVTFENNGEVCATEGTLLIKDPSLVGLSLQKGAWTADDAAIAIDGAAFTSIGDASVTLRGAGSIFAGIDGSLMEVSSDGFFKIADGRDFGISGSFIVDGEVRIGETGTQPSTLFVDAQIVNEGNVHLAPNAGMIVVRSGHIIGAEGEFGGSGEQIGNLHNDGVVDPGPDDTDTGGAGLLQIRDGIYRQGQEGRVIIEIGGLAPVEQHDVLAVDFAEFDPSGGERAGVLEVRLIDGYRPSLGDEFEVMRFQERIGEFAIYEGLMGGGVVLEPRYTRQSLVLTVVGVCYADCDGSGQLDFFDFLCFQNAFAMGEPYADCDQTGGLDFFDFLCFQNEFAQGCE